MDDKKKLRRMAIWMITIFATAFAIVLTVLYLVAGNNIVLALVSGWWLILILAVICLAAYFGYKMYIGRKK
ncbi:MAG: hypothetical protein FD146_2035 [Anaerolineaceae bacterium]|nr:MAG: hypothetical protein FD146_2035 [Anaerolineaceae bacterium]